MNIEYIQITFPNYQKIKNMDGFIIETTNLNESELLDLEIIIFCAFTNQGSNYPWIGEWIEERKVNKDVTYSFFDDYIKFTRINNQKRNFIIIEPHIEESDFIVALATMLIIGYEIHFFTNEKSFDLKELYLLPNTFYQGKDILRSIYR